MSMICELFLIPSQAAEQLIADPGNIHSTLQSLEGSDSVLSLEKSWHGLHYVLTGTAWEGDPPLNFLAGGGTPVGTEDVGYGPARVLGSEEVNALDTALTGFSESDFNRNFDLDGMSREAIYPQIWDEPLEELSQEYGSYLWEMKAFVNRAAESGKALLVAIR